MVNKAVLSHFHYDIDIRLNSSEFDTDLALKKRFFVFVLSNPFEIFLKRIFNFHTSNKRTLNKGDCEAIFEIIHGLVIRYGFISFFEDVSFV